MTFSIRWLVPTTFVFLTGAQRGYARWGSKEWWEGERELPVPIPCIPSILPCVVTYGFPLWTTPKMPCQFLATDPRSHYHESAYCFEYPKDPYLNQATQKSTCQNFRTRNPKFQTPQKSFQHPCHFKSRVPFSCSSVTSSLTWLTICDWTVPAFHPLTVSPK